MRSPYTSRSGVEIVTGKKGFENIVGKGENAGNHHFLRNPQRVLPFEKHFPHFRHLYFVAGKNFEFEKVHNFVDCEKVMNW